MIASSGSSATKWIARVLDLHPDIKCWHANEETKDQSTLNSVDSFANSLSKQAADTNQYVGAIHITPWHGRELQNNIESANGRFCGVLRNPILRINSQSVAKIQIHAVSYDHYFKNLRWFSTYYNDLLVKLIANNPEPPSFGKVEFALAAYNCLKSDHALLQLNSEQIFRFEDLTTKPNHFKDFVDYLCKDIQLDSGYLEDVFSYGKVNKHHAVDPGTAEDVYLSWDEPRKRIFKYIYDSFNKNNFLSHSYQELGYAIPI